MAVPPTVGQGVQGTQPAARPASNFTTSPLGARPQSPVGMAPAFGGAPAVPPQGQVMQPPIGFQGGMPSPPPMGSGNFNMGIASQIQRTLGNMHASVGRKRAAEKARWDGLRQASQAFLGGTAKIGKDAVQDMVNGKPIGETLQRAGNNTMQMAAQTFGGAAGMSEERQEELADKLTGKKPKSDEIDDTEDEKENKKEKVSLDTSGAVSKAADLVKDNSAAAAAATAAAVGKAASTVTGVATPTTGAAAAAGGTAAAAAGGMTAGTVAAGAAATMAAVGVAAYGWNKLKKKRQNTL